MKRPILRFLMFFALAVFAVLWPTNYGMDARTWWERLGWVLLLLVRALFIGYGTAMLMFRPLLTVRRPGDTPLLSLPQAMRMLWAMHKRPFAETRVSGAGHNGQHP